MKVENFGSIVEVPERSCLSGRTFLGELWTPLGFKRFLPVQYATALKAYFDMCVVYPDIKWDNLMSRKVSLIGQEVFDKDINDFYSCVKYYQQSGESYLRTRIVTLAQRCVCRKVNDCVASIMDEFTDNQKYMLEAFQTAYDNGDIPLYAHGVFGAEYHWKIDRYRRGYNNLPKNWDILMNEVRANGLDAAVFNQFAEKYSKFLTVGTYYFLKAAYAESENEATRDMFHKAVISVLEIMDGVQKSVPERLMELGPVTEFLEKMESL